MLRSISRKIIHIIYSVGRKMLIQTCQKGHKIDLITNMMIDHNQQENQQENRLNQHNEMNGPLAAENRKSTDIFCLFLFVINIGWMLIVSGSSYYYGNPQKIYRAAGNYLNHICGFPGTSAQAFPYAYYYQFQPMQQYSWLLMGACVSQCPLSSPAGSTLVTSQGLINFTLQIDHSGFTSATFTWYSNAMFYFISYDSELAFDRICVPSQATLNGGLYSLKNNMSEFSFNNLGNFIMNIKNNWQWLLLAFFLSLAISTIFFIGLRYQPKLFLWSSAIGIVIMFLIAGFLFLYNAGAFNEGPYFRAKYYYKVFGGICFAIFALFFYLTISYRNRIEQIVILCNSIWHFYAQRVNVIIIAPIVHCVLVVALWGGCLPVIIYLTSRTQFFIYTNRLGFNLTDTRQQVDQNRAGLYAFIISIFWCNALIQTATKYIIASICSIWYFRRGAEQDNNGLYLSYQIIFRYHFGSLAQGSLLLIPMQFMQTFIDLMIAIIEAQNFMNKLAKIADFLLGYSEYIIKYMNKQAYIKIVFEGKCFFYASKDGLDLMQKIKRQQKGVCFYNAYRLGSLLSSVVSLFVAAFTVIVIYFIILFHPKAKMNVLQPILLLIPVYLIADTVATIVMSVYGTAIETLVICYMIDKSQIKQNLQNIKNNNLNHQQTGEQKLQARPERNQGISKKIQKIIKLPDYIEQPSYEQVRPQEFS